MGNSGTGVGSMGLLGHRIHQPSSRRPGHDHAWRHTMLTHLQHTATRLLKVAVAESAQRVDRHAKLGQQRRCNLGSIRQRCQPPAGPAAARLPDEGMCGASRRANAMGRLVNEPSAGQQGGQVIATLGSNDRGRRRDRMGSPG
eukprot:363203-Chlamydomonas_euryale.AAC.27